MTTYYLRNWSGSIVLVDKDLNKLRRTLELMPQYNGLEVEETEEEIEEFMFVGSTDWCRYKEVALRNTRNQYLKEYVDVALSNPLRVEDMKEKEREEYEAVVAYRQYLLDFPEQENWLYNKLLSFGEWKEEQELKLK